MRSWLFHLKGELGGECFLLGLALLLVCVVLSHATAVQSDTDNCSLLFLCPGADLLLTYLNLMIADCQQNIIDKQAMFYQSRLASPQAAAVAIYPLQQHPPPQQQQQHCQSMMSAPASSPPPDYLVPAAGAVAALGSTATCTTCSTGLTLLDAVQATRGDGSSGSRLG